MQSPITLLMTHRKAAGLLGFVKDPEVIVYKRCVDIAIECRWQVQPVDCLWDTTKCAMQRKTDSEAALNTDMVDHRYERPSN